jgi:hypothetical protein
LAVLEQTTARPPARPTSPLARRPDAQTLHWALPTIVAAALAGLYLVLAPSSVDLAAHLFRAEMFRQQGFATWNNYWYGGNEVLGYSVLFPAVSAALTPQLAAALAATGTATVFTVLARRHFGDRALAGAILFAAATAADLYSGRLAFAFGALPALAAVLALDSRRPVTACLLAVVSALCSPVAALFAALVAGGYVLGGVILALRDPAASPGHRTGGQASRSAVIAAGATDSQASRSAVIAAGATDTQASRSATIAALPGVAVIVAALAPVLLISEIFPQGGSEPFAFTTMLPLVGVSVIALILLPRDQVRLRAGVAVYAVATVAVYLIATPIGSNIARMGTFAALPLATLVCWGRRPRLLALVFLPLLYIGWSPSIRDGIAGDVDHTASTAFYRPLLHFLDRQAALPGAAPFRIEIPFTSFHWEAYEIATRFSLARGWERQLDIRYNHIFYGGRLTVGTYRRWLHDNAVRFVAISSAEPDYSARAEVKLIDAGLPYLHQVFRSPNWRVYQVARATPIVQAPAVLARLTAGSLTIRLPRPGTFEVRIRFTPYWRLSGGAGCVAPDGNWTKLTIGHAEQVRLSTSFSLSRIGATSPRCSS